MFSFFSTLTVTVSLVQRHVVHSDVAAHAVVAPNALDHNLKKKKVKKRLCKNRMQSIEPAIFLVASPVFFFELRFNVGSKKE